MDKQELVNKFLALRDDAFSPARAEIEEYLLEYLMKLYDSGEYNLTTLVTRLTSLPELNFITDPECDIPDTVKLLSSTENEVITVTATLSEYHASVNITCEPQNVMATGEVSLDPRHIAFYAEWEKLLHISSLDELQDLSESEKAVYFVGLLESQVMNGGIGQYLANTDGEFVEETINYLKAIGAEKTCQVLSNAVDLKRPTQSYDDVWNEYAGQLAQLDQTFMEQSEDLAALTADKFL